MPLPQHVCSCILKTLTQTILCGDSWGAVAIPIIKARPATILISGAIWASFDVGMMNLIQAIIVDSAAHGRELDGEFQAKAKTLNLGGAGAQHNQVGSHPSPPLPALFVW